MRYWILLCAVLQGCGYRTSPTEQVSLSIPFIKGDDRAALTNLLIEELVSTGKFSYSTEDSSLILEAEIVSFDDPHIGYQYDRHAISGKLIKRLVPNEARNEVILRFSVLDRTGKVVFGPQEIKESTDYDFVYSDTVKDLIFTNEEGKTQSVLFFSLGQLDASEGARDIAKMVTYQKLAKRVSEGLAELHLERG